MVRPSAWFTVLVGRTRLRVPELGWEPKRIQGGDSLGRKNAGEGDAACRQRRTMANAPCQGPEPEASPGPRLPRLKKLLVMGAVLAILHLVVATPHFVVRLLRGSPIESFTGVEGFAPVTDVVWRGAAPSPAGYTALAEAGVVAVVDLRAEADPMTSFNQAAESGLAWVHVPIRDGQTPTATQLAQIDAIIAGATGPVFIHCQAGVGRTGSVIAALRVGQGHSPGGELMEALRFGPLSLEQQVFILQSGQEQSVTPRLAVAAASRIIDSPRRLWSHLTG